MPSEWLGVHGGRSYGPVPRGKRLPGPAVCSVLCFFQYSWTGKTLPQPEFDIF